MQDVEERVDKLELMVQRVTENLDKFIENTYKMFQESDRRWEERLAKEKQEYEEKLAKEREEREKEFKREREEREKQRIREKQEYEEKLAKEREEREKEFKREREEREKDFKKFKEEWRRELGELSLKLGTLVEDMVAPSMENIAKKYFGCVDIDFESIRVRKKKPKDKSKMKEFDYILICGDTIILNETKAYPRSEYAKCFVKFIKSGEFFEYFPEHKGKKLIPIFSTLYMPDNIIKYLSTNNIYAMGLKGDEMDILNFNKVKG